MNNDNSASDFVEMTVDVVSAYVSRNHVNAADLGPIIATIHKALISLGRPAVAPQAEKPSPFVSVKKSITPDYLISLEDGKRYKSLKRHLSGRGMTPDQYRDKWGLPSSYPMVASEYAKKRSELARSMGLGRRRTETDSAPTPEPAPEPEAAAPAKRGRPKKG